MGTQNAVNISAAGIVKYDGAGAFSADTVTNHSVLIGGSSNAITSLALTNGQLAIGSTGADPTAATITAGTGITVTNGAGSITISASTSGFTWNNVTTGTQTIAVQNGYISNSGSGVVYTLPATANLGDTFIIIGVADVSTITPNASQQLIIGNAIGNVGATGTAVTGEIGNSVQFVCTIAGASTVWRAISVVGNWTLN